MKSSILFFLILLSQPSFSQDLIGKWTGKYSYDRITHEVGIALRIELNPDSSLNIHSYTLVENADQQPSALLCRVAVLKNRNNVLELLETDSTGSDASGLQRMYLKYIKKGDVERLEGNWDAGGSGPFSGGSIFFVKLKEL